MITTVSLKNFTVFEQLNLECAPGINVFIGENGTGKTHLLKVIYSACQITQGESPDGATIPINLSQLFALSQPSPLIRAGSERTEVHLQQDTNRNLDYTFSGVESSPSAAFCTSDKPNLDSWCEATIPSTYIPVKEILSNAPGFRSLYSKREVAFEKVYYDIIDQAFLPPLHNGAAPVSILEKVERTMGGTIEQEGERFFLKTPESRFDFMVVAEGLKKLGLLWLLIKNGSIAKGSVLCWDEPDANLNPKLLKTVVSILLELQKMGVQIFLSTHNYVLLKEFDLQCQSSDQIRFHALYRDAATQSVQVESTENYLQINPNAIADTFADLYDRDLDRALGGGE